MWGITGWMMGGGGGGGGAYYNQFDIRQHTYERAHAPADTRALARTHANVERHLMAMARFSSCQVITR